MYSYGDGYHTVLILTTTLWLFSGLFVIYLLRNIWERTIPLVFFSISVWTSLKIQTVFFIKGCSRRAGIWSTHKGTLQTTCEKQFSGLDAYNSGKCWIPAVTRSKGTLALLELDSLGAESSQIGPQSLWMCSFVVLSERQENSTGSEENTDYNRSGLCIFSVFVYAAQYLCASII